VMVMSIEFFCMLAALYYQRTTRSDILN
jgi:hypothetical protein